MKRSNHRGRTSCIKVLLFSIPRLIACCTSATTVAVLLQLPAFVTSCARAQLTDHSRKGQQIYIQWTKNPSQALLDCFYFDTEPPENLDSYQQIPISGNGTVAGVSTLGPRRLVVLSQNGSGDWYGIRTYADLCKLRFSLADEDPDRPQMLGEAVLGEALSQPCSLSLRPALTRIGLRSISADFRRYPYAGEPFVCTGVYLAYAVTECLPLAIGKARPAPLSWLNAGEPDSTQVLRLPHPEMLLQEGFGTVGPARRTLSLDFYCYPGPQLRLVLAGKVGEDLCYYPVPLGNLQAGQSYELDLTLTRKGAPSADLPVQSGTVLVESASIPWEWKDVLEIEL